jgi:hypothetical protein
MQLLTKDIVNLFVLMNTKARGDGLPSLLPSGGQGGTRDLLPSLESGPHLVMIRRSGQPTPVRVEVLRDRTIDRKKTLRLTRGFEPLHPALPLPGGLMRVRGTIIESASDGLRLGATRAWRLQSSSIYR